MPLALTAVVAAPAQEMFVAGTRARGIYATLPQPSSAERPPPGPRGGHNDGHPFQLGVEAYIDDVTPNGGGLQLWPQAHRRLFPSYLRQHTRSPIDVRDSGAWGVAPGQIIQQIMEDTTPVDTYGPRGTVIFWHHVRMFHDDAHTTDPQSDPIAVATASALPLSELARRSKCLLPRHALYSNTIPHN